MFSSLASPSSQVDPGQGPAVAPEAVDRAGHQFLAVGLEDLLHLGDELLLALQAQLLAELVAHLHEELGLAGVEIHVDVLEGKHRRADDHQARSPD